MYALFCLLFYVTKQYLNWIYKQLGNEEFYWENRVNTIINTNPTGLDLIAYLLILFILYITQNYVVFHDLFMK